MNYIVIQIEVHNVFIGQKFRIYIIIILSHDDHHLIQYLTELHENCFDQFTRSIFLFNLNL